MAKPTNDDGPSGDMLELDPGGFLPAVMRRRTSAVPVRRAVPRTVIVPFSPMVIAGGASVSMTAYTQESFRPARLVPARSYPMLRLHELKIGACPQFGTFGGIAFPVFEDGPKIDKLIERLDALTIKAADAALLEDLRREIESIRDNLGQRDVCQVAMNLSALIVNAGVEAVTVEFSISGPALV